MESVTMVFNFCSTLAKKESMFILEEELVRLSPSG